MINWDISKEDSLIIGKIAQRAVKLLGTDFIDTSMDITAVHLNDTPLRLNDLLNADDFNFAHDVNGIAGHLNRQTGMLMNCFLPRFSGK
jgi:hypothetical protein